MCANCVTTADVVVGSIAFGSFLLRGPVQHALVERGIIPEPHPLAMEMRTVMFLRDLDLDPVEILGAETVAAVDRALAWPQPRVYRERSARAGLGSMRSQSADATQ
jgi:hypothetical protein